MRSSIILFITLSCSIIGLINARVIPDAIDNHQEAYVGLSKRTTAGASLSRHTGRGTVNSRLGQKKKFKKAKARKGLASEILHALGGKGALNL